MTSPWLFFCEELIKPGSIDIENRPSHNSRPRSVTEQILRMVAESDEQSREELQPLYEAIDPDAFTAFFAPRADGSPHTGGEVSFEYAGYWVTVSSEGAVEIDAPDR
ncbi:HalOD1 output domain-containing protein [Haladaptatus caseinilyticus]|uniref:HalOD1 output domain-containing protein n=1 Tax=Haladaptatus caseinilyticus TaxID=2993314 RepID=UPI00224A7351|nr:HalOD1 output domain-containing protein [Haladaptatus caseinilyticus]